MIRGLKLPVAFFSSLKIFQQIAFSSYLSNEPPPHLMFFLGKSRRSIWIPFEERPASLPPRIVSPEVWFFHRFCFGNSNVSPPVFFEWTASLSPHLILRYAPLPLRVSCWDSGRPPSTAEVVKTPVSLPQPTGDLHQATKGISELLHFFDQLLCTEDFL